MKLHYDNVKTNKFSNLGEVHRSLSEEEKSIIQLSIKNTYNEFINHVSTARNLTIKEVDAIGQGRVWTGLRAEKIGLVDSIGGLNDAIQTAAQLASLEDFNIVEYPKSKTGLESIISDLESAKKLKGQSIEEIYLNQLKNKFLNMQGIQARLPVEYKLD
jgi:protease-4